jgi:hypothetical protein
MKQKKSLILGYHILKEMTCLHGNLRKMGFFTVKSAYKLAEEWRSFENCGSNISRDYSKKLYAKFGQHWCLKRKEFSCGHLL